MVKVGLNTSSSYNINSKVNLDGVAYTMHVYWNYRAGWFIDMLDAAYNPLILGKQIMPNTSILKGTGILTGALVCMDTEASAEEELTASNFGTRKRFQLVYVSTEEAQSYPQLV